MSDIEDLRRKVTLLYQLFHAGSVKTMTTQHEVNPGLETGGRVNYMYFTLPVSLNFQRSSPAMWQSALKTFEDNKTNYLFYPEKVVTVSRETVQADLAKHRLALQTNKHTDIWIKLSQTLHDFYQDDPRNIIDECDHDVVKILSLLRKERKKDFPYLSGAKMANYWLFILSKFTDVQLKNVHEISIIPDTHVIQCSRHLGICQSEQPEVVAAEWRRVLEGTGINPVDMHPVLWNWSRAGFEPHV